ncbi:hypothetical protein ACIPRD_22860 [Streptomyces sp. NPDC090108]|uniref:hypothetical protein n=1 Tax=Streptomyces sp. NPDC090108 TaxID=3365947 RepID=UPI00381FA88C
MRVRSRALLADMPMPRRTPIALSMLGVAMLFPVAACSADRSGTGQPARSGHATSSHAAAPTAPSGTEPAVQKPPELDADETLAGRRTATTGNAEVGFAKGRKGDALIVAVRCQGKGTVEVAVRPVHVAFPLKCLAGKVSTTYNQVAVSGADHDGTVSVEAPTTVRWSLTVGRSAPAGEESPGTP